jgi:hypothetical protein
MSLTLEMHKRQDGFHQQSRHLQATGGQYPFQQSFFPSSFTSYGSTCCSTLLAQISDLPHPPPAQGYTSSLSTQSSPATPSSCLALFSSHGLKRNKYFYIIFVQNLRNFRLVPLRNEICALLGCYAAYMLNPYRRFGTTCRFHLHGSRNSRRKPIKWER